MQTIVLLAALLAVTGLQQKPAPPKPAPVNTAPPAAPAPFENPYTPDELKDKQAVIETAAGAIVLDLLADAAPKHVAHFIKTARDGGYDGTLFHRVIKHGIIQGGDPLSKDPAAKDRYGTGGLNRLKPELERREAHARRRVGGAGAEPSRQRRHTVLHLHRRSAGARRPVHGVRARRRGHPRRAENLRGGRPTRRARRPSASR